MYVQDMLILMMYQQVSIICRRGKNALSSSEKICGKSTTYCWKSTNVLGKEPFSFKDLFKMYSRVIIFVIFNKVGCER